MRLVLSFLYVFIFVTALITSLYNVTMTECVYLKKILVINLLKSALYVETNKIIVILYHMLCQIAIKIVDFIQLFSLIGITQKSDGILPSCVYAKPTSHLSEQAPLYH